MVFINYYFFENQIMCVCDVRLFIRSKQFFQFNYEAQGEISYLTGKKKFPIFPFVHFPFFIKEKIEKKRSVFSSNSIEQKIVDKSVKTLLQEECLIKHDGRNRFTSCKKNLSLVQCTHKKPQNYNDEKLQIGQITLTWFYVYHRCRRCVQLSLNNFQRCHIRGVVATKAEFHDSKLPSYRFILLFLSTVNFSLFLLALLLLPMYTVYIAGTFAWLIHNFAAVAVLSLSLSLIFLLCFYRFLSSIRRA